MNGTRPPMRKSGHEPIRIIEISDEYILGIYDRENITSIKQIKYRQRDESANSGWSRIKTCKDIFRIIDILKISEENLSNIIDDLYKLSMKHNNEQLLKVFPVDDKFILGVYQGRLSEYDLWIKYRQKVNNNWSVIRTPKHIHWAVDILIKMSLEENKTKEFLEFLIDYWDNNVTPLRSENDRNLLLSDELLNEINNEVTLYQELVEKGEYSVKFLLLLAKLIMFQEKTNLDTAYMFRNLLEALKEGEDIFKIVSIATHNRR